MKFNLVQALIQIFVLYGLTVPVCADYTTQTVVTSGFSATSHTTRLLPSDGGEFSSTAGGGLKDGAVTYILPSSTDVKPGWRFTIIRDGGLSANVLAQGNDNILVPTPTRTYTGLAIGGGNGDFVTLDYIGFGHFTVENASPAVWAAMGASGTATPPQSANSYLEGNTFTLDGAPATVVIAKDLVVVDPISKSAATIPFINTTTLYRNSGPVLNGRDTSTPCSPSEQGYIYVVRDPVTGVSGSVRSSKATGPALDGALVPYTQWAGPLFAYVTDNSCNPYSLEGYGKSFWFTNANASPLIYLARGVSGKFHISKMVASDWAAVSISDFVPDLARNIYVAYGCNGSQSITAHVMLAPSNSWSAPQPNNADTSPTVPLAITIGAGAIDLRQAKIAIKDEMGRSFSWVSDNEACSIQLQGWEF